MLKIYIYIFFLSLNSSQLILIPNFSEGFLNVNFYTQKAKLLMTKILPENILSENNEYLFQTFK